VGSPKWHALPEFREHVFECEEPSCVRDVRDSAPLLRSLVRSLPSGARRADGHSRGSSPGGPGDSPHGPMHAHELGFVCKS
jgi:hypothetical protein